MVAMSTTDNSQQEGERKLLTEVSAFPAVAVKSLQVISRERSQLHDLSELIASDAAISGGILRMANSALFNVRVEISSILQAIHMLGLERVKGVVVTIAMKNYLDGSLEGPALRACWRHSLACAVIAQEFAKVGMMEADVAYTAGLMHDIGRLALMATYPKEYADFIAGEENESAGTLQRERDSFGVDHCQAGRLLVQRWNLPPMFAEVTSRHHEAPSAGEPVVLSVVRRSCMMADTLGFGILQTGQTRAYEEILQEIS
jgi:putative nucleotidyltransferase with HDIG domain